MNPSEHETLKLLIGLCDDLARGKSVDERRLYALTSDSAVPGELARLAEAFGLMLVKLEARDMHTLNLIHTLQRKNEELEDIRARLARRNQNLEEAVLKTWNPRQLQGQSQSMQNIVRTCVQIARRPINTMILGETGTGKEVVAKMIHYNSLRRDQPFLAVNCSAIPESLFESEMFGIEKGVATGVGERKGLLEAASGGTLFLDELSDMSLPNQAKLLRALQDGEIRRVGGKKPIQVDVLVISATSQDIEMAIADKRFRSDLYYRLNVAEIVLPPLKDRGEDVLILARHFLHQHAQRLGRPTPELSDNVRSALMAYAWPGNVRELSNEMERLAALAADQKILMGDLSQRIRGSGIVHTAEPTLGGKAPPAGVSLADLWGLPHEHDAMFTHADAAASLPPMAPRAASGAGLNELARQAVEEALALCGGNKTQAARRLGLSREGLRKKMKRLGIGGDGEAG